MTFDATFYISIISSTLLTISEILPYVQKIQSNGILQCISEIIKQKPTSESEPLLNNFQSKIIAKLNSIENMTIQMEKDIEKITIIVE